MFWMKSSLNIKRVLRTKRNVGLRSLWLFQRQIDCTADLIVVGLINLLE